jgi:hypothetical protein
MQEAERDNRELPRHFAASITYACGLPDPRAKHPVSALSSKWRRVTYSKATLHWAMAQWKSHAVIKDGGAQWKKMLSPAADEFNCLFGRAQMPGRPFPQASPPRMQGQGRTGTGQLPQGEPMEEATSGVSMEDIGLLVKTLIDAQLVAQVVLMNAHNTNLIAFHTETAKAMMMKATGKDSKLTPAKKKILMACTGHPDFPKFFAPAVYRDMDVEGGTADALGRIL